ncbi:hemerythrin [Rhizocola hellebori]|uniref:Hemerythrin n=1 Tax=Rhizocola hellebori TaxID=1392758 RepID=A0A8J3Q6N9_9ACTN|nr:hemerythrin domain-containing protein [Rhizocola hellebori]GIH05043.1 hemerythrin [Rhizocola hellebori]
MSFDLGCFGRDGHGYLEPMIPSLPPLPPLPGENDELNYRPGGRSIIAVLADEHQQLTELAAELARSSEPTQELADVVTAAVSRHLSSEEQYLYPTVKALLPDGQQLSEREIERDTQILKQLALLETLPRDSTAFTELASAIDTDLHHHREACAADIFPLLRDLASEAELIRLGNRIEVAQEAAPTRPHPDSPMSPPWNKITDPALGIVDKIRDVVSGRTTYPEDLPGK